MKALIIEDELSASKHLRNILTATGNITVIGVLESITDTIEWFNANGEPDIVFMDIHLADGTAFEIFNHITISCPIIFTTAYDEYALRAFKVNSIDYLLKPIENEAVNNALKKLNTLTDRSGINETLSGLLKSYRTVPVYKTHFLIPAKGDKLLPLRSSDIACFFIDAGTVKAFTSDGRSFRIENTLDELACQLDPSVFFRANRQFIISREAIKDIDFWFNSRLSVNLKISVPEKILISKARLSEFREWFSGK
jgi:DNA-binding LytR/AlgR family response regulator